MEVHHHSSHHEGRKGFKEYFQEFLMIFLAVTLGFLAENVREYITDNNHVVELAGQLKEDLMNDTTNLEKLALSLDIQVLRIDSLFSLLTQPGKQKDLIRIQQLIRSSDNMNIFYPSTGAISTIKTELHLKKFVKTKLASHIDNYEKKINVLHEIENRDIEYMGKILETFMSKHLTPENAAAVVMQKILPEGKFRNISDEDLIQLSVDINLLKAYNLQLLNRCVEIKSDAVAFIRHINSTYNLEE
ncbi:MAG TPA: hypothetical protein VK772_16570 [Puia sp.]|jgi:hypothetical protein|nr:hypothetical protein [Puia sp.]